MAFKVFLSHSTRDASVVTLLSRMLCEFGVDVFVAEWYLAPGEKISSKVFKAIDRSDCLVALLTRDGLRSPWVQQEIGYAFAKNIRVIPILEQGTAVPGALEGREAIWFDRDEPVEALGRTAHFVKGLKLEKEKKEELLLVTGGLVAFLFLLKGLK